MKEILKKTIIGFLFITVFVGSICLIAIIAEAIITHIVLNVSITNIFLALYAIFAIFISYHIGDYLLEMKKKRGI